MGRREMAKTLRTQFAIYYALPAVPPVLIGAPFILHLARGHLRFLLGPGGDLVSEAGALPDFVHHDGQVVEVLIGYGLRRFGGVGLVVDRQADYAALRSIAGYRTAELKEGQYLIHCMTYLEGPLKAYKEPLTLGGVTLQPGGLYTEPLSQGSENGRGYILVVPDEAAGGLSVHHNIIDNPSKIREKIGILFGGDVALYDRLTGRENMTYFAKLNNLLDRTSKPVDGSSNNITSG